MADSTTRSLRVLLAGGLSFVAIVLALAYYPLLTLRVIAAILCLLSAAIISLNYATLWRCWKTKENHSMAGVIGGILGVFGMMISTVREVQPWVPAVVDPSFVPSLLWLAVYMIFLRKHEKAPGQDDS